MLKGALFYALIYACRIAGSVFYSVIADERLKQAFWPQQLYRNIKSISIFIMRIRIIEFFLKKLVYADSLNYRSVFQKNCSCPLAA